MQNILMGADNHNGHKLEELAAQLRNEIEAKSEKIAHDHSHAAQFVLNNNRTIIGCLEVIEDLQRRSLAMLDLLGADQGPAGTPRIGGRADD